VLSFQPPIPAGNGSHQHGRKYQLREEMNYTSAAVAAPLATFEWPGALQFSLLLDYM
jgi:hypothetical protein